MFNNIAHDGWTPNNATRCRLISGLLAGPRKPAAQWLPTALEVWHAMRATSAETDRPLWPRDLSVGLHVCCRAGRMREATDIFAQIVSPDRQDYNVLVRGFGAAGDVSAAEAVMEKMALRGVAADAVTHNSMVASMCEAGQRGRARAWLQGAAGRGEPVDQWAWSALLQVPGISAWPGAWRPARQTRAWWSGGHCAAAASLPRLVLPRGEHLTRSQA